MNRPALLDPPAVLGPDDDGREMSLDAYLACEKTEGYRYELARGRIVVSFVPNRLHLAVLLAVENLLVDWQRDGRRGEYQILDASKMALLVPEYDSVRHPDTCVYPWPMPAEVDGRQLWETWLPSLAVEVVSPGSRHRDYVEKREEYLAAGVGEYWIVDPKDKCLLQLVADAGAWDERPQDLVAGRQTAAATLSDLVLPHDAILDAILDAVSDAAADGA